MPELASSSAPGASASPRFLLCSAGIWWLETRYFPSGSFARIDAQSLYGMERRKRGSELGPLGLSQLNRNNLLLLHFISHPLPSSEYQLLVIDCFRTILSTMVNPTWTVRTECFNNAAVVRLCFVFHEALPATLQCGAAGCSEITYVFDGTKMSIAKRHSFKHFLLSCVARQSSNGITTC